MNHLEDAAYSTEIIANGNTPILRALFDSLSCSFYQKLSELPTLPSPNITPNAIFQRGLYSEHSDRTALYGMNSVLGEYKLFIESKAVSILGRHGRVVVEALVTLRGSNFPYGSYHTSPL